MTADGRNPAHDPDRSAFRYLYDELGRIFRIDSYEGQSHLDESDGGVDSEDPASTTTFTFPDAPCAGRGGAAELVFDDAGRVRQILGLDCCSSPIVWDYDYESAASA